MCEDAPCCGCCPEDGGTIDPRAFDPDDGYMFDAP